MAASADERKALTEEAFREANEKLARAARELLGGEEESLVPFLCECPRQDCMQVVFLTLREYEDVRSRPAGGVGALGHEDPSVERVVAENERFVTTEKFGRAGEVHEATDPRAVNDERTRRVGHNEALYRQVNERIEELHDAWGESSGTFALVCECGELQCMEQITVSPARYEAIRAHPSRFIVKPGHEAPDVESVVDRGGEFFVVEKHPGEPERIAEETDRRA